MRPTFSRALSAIGRHNQQPNVDESAVMNAGWEAMQKADPNLANAVMRMPPEIARGVVFQYTNAIRQGADDQASTLAANFAREQLASFSPSNLPGASLGGLIGGRMGALSKFANKQRVYDVGAFEKAMSRQVQPQSLNLPRIKSPFARQANVQPQDPFQAVRDQYKNFNQSGWSEYEKNLLWDRPQDRDFQAPQNWAVPVQEPDGLVDGSMNRNFNQFGNF